MQRKSLGVILRNASCTTPIHIAELVLPVSAVHVAQAVLRLAKVLRCVSCIELMPDALQELGRNPNASCTTPIHIAELVLPVSAARITRKIPTLVLGWGAIT